jgi:hypothetical protein
MKTIIRITLTILLTIGVVLASKESSEINLAFSNYKKGKPVTEKFEPKISTLGTLITAHTYTIPQILHVMQKVRVGTIPVKIEDLELLLKKHEKKTFIALDPEYGRFVKAKDYEAMLCKELIALIKERKIQQDKTQQDNK